MAEKYDATVTKKVFHSRQGVAQVEAHFQSKCISLDCAISIKANFLSKVHFQSKCRLEH